MKDVLQRKKSAGEVRNYIKNFPVTAILGPRQCGKTVLAKGINYDHYFDLENPRDLAKLDQAQLTLEDLEGLIVIDEIQRIPDLFPLMRHLVDTQKNQKYLILGNASGKLMRQSSESLAGRIAYSYLGGFQLADVGSQNLKKLWLRGGFPRAYLAESQSSALSWLNQYITTFLERDIPQLGISIPANTLRRFWIMLSHYHGQVLNFSEIGRSFGISDVTVRKYIDILDGTFMIRILQPWHVNTKKRVVKKPKIYLRDSGIFHIFLSVENMEQLLSHNKLGASWEGFALECVIQGIGKRNEELYFWSTHTGAEIDLFWQSKGKNWGIEFKYSDAPNLTKSMKIAKSDLQLDHLWVIYPGRDKYKLDRDISVLPLKNIGSDWRYPG